MPKGVMLVQSAPSDPAREDEYNVWYADTHIPQVLDVPGITGARRYKLHSDSGDGPTYLAVYDLDAYDLTVPVKELGTRLALGYIETSDALQVDPPPAITVYEVLTAPASWRLIPE